jgi:very-short-patch-repair endonuclease
MVEARVPFDSTTVMHLLKVFTRQSASATPQGLVNVLWSLGKMVETGTRFDVAVVIPLLEAFMSQSARVSPRDIANVLWSVGKIVEAGARFDLHIIMPLLEIFICQNKDADLQSQTNIIWVMGIINSQTPLSIDSDKLIKDAIAGCNSSTSIMHKNQLINGLSLLGVIERYEVSHFIKQCRPKSSLKDGDIPKSLSTSRGSALLDVEKEAFVSGYYVDALLTYANGDKVVFESDGIYHKDDRHHIIDQFRDAILLRKGYSVCRMDAATRAVHWPGSVLSSCSKDYPKVTNIPVDPMHSSERGVGFKRVRSALDTPSTGGKTRAEVFIVPTMSAHTASGGADSSFFSHSVVRGEDDGTVAQSSGKKARK